MRARRPDELLVFVLAAAARLAVVFTSGGLRGNYGYDASVYYAAATGLVHGRLPYRDFVLLHPPGLALALAPFAWLGRLTIDQTGFLAACLGFTALGAVNAVLVMRVGTRIGLGRWPVLLGGLCYGLWYGSVHAEYLPRLEPLGNFLVLCGLLAFFAAERSVHVASERPGRVWLSVLSGAAFAAAASVKIWWVVPLAVVLAWHLVARRARRGLPWFALGAAAAGLAIDGPFFAFAPSQMWHMVVTEQLGRISTSATTLTRLGNLTDLGRVPGIGAGALLLAGVVLVGALFAALCVLAWRIPGARLLVALAVAQICVLVAAPSYFTFYSDYIAPPAALVIASGAAALLRRAAEPRRTAWRAGWAVLPLVWIVVVTAGVIGGHRTNVVQSFPAAARLSRVVAHMRCVQSDSPMALIEVNALNRSFANGCRQWVDVTGRTYGPDAAPRGVSRLANAKWQRDLRAYLLSGNAALIFRASGTQPSRATVAALRHGGVLATSPGAVVYRTPHKAQARTVAPSASTTSASGSSNQRPPEPR